MGAETICSGACNPLASHDWFRITFIDCETVPFHVTASLIIAFFKYCLFYSFLDFQKKVLRCFAELKDLLTRLGKVYEREESDFFVETVKTHEEYQELEESFEDPEKKKLFVSSTFHAFAIKLMCS